MTRTHTQQYQPTPDRGTAAAVGREQRPGLRGVAARWPQLSPTQTRQLYDLVYCRAPEHLRPPLPPARADQSQRGAPWSRLACGAPLLWAARAEQRYARRRAAPAAQAA